MKLKPTPVFLMPDMSCGLPPPDVQSSSIPRQPRIRHVLAENHPLEFYDGDPALDALVEMVGTEGMKEFGRFVSGGFRMVELVGLIDDPADQLPSYIRDDLKPHVPVLPLVSNKTKLVANALVTVALRGVGATICGPYEKQVFLSPSASSSSSKVLAWKLVAFPGIEEVSEGELWWAEVPPVVFDVHDPDNDWEGLIPSPACVVDLFIHGY